jgi:hypothetical protein
MPRRKSPNIDAQIEGLLTWLFAGLVVFASVLGLFGQLFR